MKLTDYKKWYKVLFWGHPTKLAHIIWTRDEDLWEDPDLKKRMELMGFRSVYCESYMRGVYAGMCRPPVAK